MFGLKVTLRGSEPIVLALPQDRYVVSAGARLGHRRHERAPGWQFQASGIDENDDDLRWFSAKCPRRQSALNISVVDSANATLPRRIPGRHVDWHDVFAQQIQHDRARLVLLEERLRHVLAGTHVAAPPWVGKPATVAIRVSLNDRLLGRITVEQPGVLSATVYAKRKGSRRSAALSIQGGAQTGPQSWRWYDWTHLSRPLEVGDRVRLEFIDPQTSTPNTVRTIENDVSTRQAVAAEIANIRTRLRSDYYARQEASMREYSQARPKPHRYPRPA